MSDLLSLDEVEDDITEALDEDRKNVNEAEKVVEEQIDEDVEKAQKEADEEREEDDEEDEETEQDEKDLEEVQDSLEYYAFVGGDRVAKLLMIKSIERLALRRGLPTPTSALESFQDDEDVEGLVEFVQEQRNEIQKDRSTVIKERNDKRLSAWKLVDDAVEKLIRLIKEGEAGSVSDLDSTGQMALKWDSLDEKNRKDFEMLVNQQGHWVDDVITTLSVTKQSVRAMILAIEAEVRHYAIVQDRPDQAPGYGYFLADLKRGRECLFKEPLIGAFNLRINPKCGEDTAPHTYAPEPISSVGEITVSNDVAGVNEDALGDHRELDTLQEITLSVLKTARKASGGFVKLYESDLDIDAPNLSIHLVIRMLRILVALRRTLSLSVDQTDDQV